jgi:hypothetical protein
MPFAIRVVPHNQRVAQIRSAREHASSQRPLQFRGRQEELPLVRISSMLPIYRLKNGRTRVRQGTILRQDSSLPRDFFTAGQESESAQTQQHVILLDMAQDPKGPIYQELERLAEQTEPLVITSDGVVVNGNRRLAAMRHLFAEDPEHYRSFEAVDLLVLPEDADDPDIERLEVRLQMAVETKLAYGWLEERLKIRSLVEDLRMNNADVALLMGYTRNGAEQVNDELHELDLVDEYLAFRGAPGEYSTVASDTEQHFGEMADRVYKKAGAQREIAKVIGFTLLKGQASVEGRLYNYRESFGKYAESIGRTLAEEEELIQPPPAQPADSSHGDDPLDALLPAEDATLTAVAGWMSAHEDSSEVARRIADIHQELKAADQDDDRRQRAVRSLRQIHARLNDIDMQELDPQYRGEADGLLDRIATRAIALKEELERLQHPDGQ